MGHTITQRNHKSKNADAWPTTQTAWHDGHKKDKDNSELRPKGCYYRWGNRTLLTPSTTTTIKGISNEVKGGASLAMRSPRAF